MVGDSTQLFLSREGLSGEVLADRLLGLSPSCRRIRGRGSLLVSQQPPHKAAELAPGDFSVRGEVLSSRLSFPSWAETVFKRQLQPAPTSQGQHCTVDALAKVSGSFPRALTSAGGLCQLGPFSTQPSHGAT